MKIQTQTRMSLSRAALAWLALTVMLKVVIDLTGVQTLGVALDDHWQFLDLPELLANPIHSLMSLHSQPPLLNLVVFVLAKLPGDLYGNFVWLNAACAGLTTVLLMRIGAGLGLGVFVCCLLGVAYIFSPAVILNTAYPFYPNLTALGYAAMAFAFLCACQGRAAGLVLFGVSAVYLGWLRSSFSIAHLLALMSVLYLVSSAPVKRGAWLTLLCVSIAFSLIVPVKNKLMYGFFGASSWGSLNIANGLDIQGPLGAFPWPSVIREEMPALKCAHSYGFQDESDFKRNGEPNYNSCLILAYGAVLKEQVLEQYTFKQHARQMAIHFLRYIALPDKYMFLQSRGKIKAYADRYDQMWLPIRWSGRGAFSGHDERLAVLVVLSGALCAFWRYRNPLLGALLAMLLLHAAAHILTDGKEAQRFVYDVEFLLYLFYGWGLQHVIRCCLPLARRLVRREGFEQLDRGSAAPPGQ